LYRGIAINPALRDEVIHKIVSEGMQDAKKGAWQNVMPDPRVVRRQQAELEGCPEGIRDSIDRMPAEPLVYACGDRFGASYYALQHNRTGNDTCAILIEFEAPDTSLCVDGKDFLYTVFQLWDRAGTARRGKVQHILASLYGKRIGRYFDKAAASSDTKTRIGFCDLACHDLDVVNGHHGNRVLIHGRHGTQFCSSFQRQLPVHVAAIRSAASISSMPEAPADVVSLEEVLT
jgi:hypothetical protein